MSDRALRDLARRAGLSPVWVDTFGRTQMVAPDTLRAVLKALGYEAGSPSQISESLHELKAAPVPRTSEKAGTRTRAHSMKGRPDRKMWGVAAQLYALREGSSSDVGDFAALAAFAGGAAACGADAIAISPVHALFGARPSHISPYSPSTRQFLNPLYIPVPSGRARRSQDDLIDWPRVHTRRMRALKEAFRAFNGDSRFDAFVREGGERLLAHARFEILDKRFVARGVFGWRNWPSRWRDSSSASVRALRADNAEVKFQLFLQWWAATALADAQAHAKSAGMKIGLIADMAVGVDPDGSEAWARPPEMLQGLNIGAPPDAFSAAGQDWGLTTFSPAGLQASRFEGFIATLRAAMRSAGGIRLDHAMGLRRLWVIPRGHGAENGVYLDYPAEHMMRLVARESVAHKCVVIAEDLGTVPRGFRHEIARHFFFGMRVLWFERDSTGRFLPLRAWGKTAIALSTTHDLPTIAGWWTGRDISWRQKIGLTRSESQREARARTSDRRRLWKALKDARCATGGAPRGPAQVIDGSLSFLAKTPCPLAIVPAEDFLGLLEQPNLPGTTDEHPNWRRRLAPVFADGNARRRAALLTEGRKP